MKRKIIFLAYLVVFFLNSNAQGHGLDMLKLGFVEAVNYIISTTSEPEGVSLKDYILYMKISERESNFHEIEIKFNHHNHSDYWNFEIINIKNNGSLILGQLDKISYENTGIWYIDDEANGTVKIDLENSIVIVDIVFHTHNSQSNNLIMWKNN
jgi:hypothetical protein